MRCRLVMGQFDTPMARTFPAALSSTKAFHVSSWQSRHVGSSKAHGGGPHSACPGVGAGPAMLHPCGITVVLETESFGRDDPAARHGARFMSPSMPRLQSNRGKRQYTTILVPLPPYRSASAMILYTSSAWWYTLLVYRAGGAFVHVDQHMSTISGKNGKTE